MSDTGIATDLVLEVFRANGLLLAAGDGIAGREGLTSARWQVLGAVALAGAPITVPQIGRRMGLTRQSVQVTVNRLVDEDMLSAEPNEQHRRSPRFALTERGGAAYARLTVEQERWIGALTEGIAPGDLEVATQVLAEITGRLAAPDDTRGPMRFREMDEQVTYAEQLADTGAGPIELVNVFTMAPEDVASFLEVWADDAAWMTSRPGFVHTQLHHGTAGSATFVNVATWESVQDLRAAFGAPEFQAAIARYPDSVVASPHVCTPVAVPGICVGS